MADRFGLALSRSPPQADLNYRHRLGFALKRPKKRLLKADPARREAFVGEYGAPDGGGGADGNQAMLRRRGPLSGGCGSAGPVDAAR